MTDKREEIANDILSMVDENSESFESTETGNEKGVTKLLFSLESERGLLGACLINGHIVDDVSPLVNSTEFHNKQNGETFGAILQLRDEGIGVDIAILTDRLKDAATFKDVDPAAFLTELTESHFTAFNAAYYANKIREYANRRNLLETLTDGQQRLENGESTETVWSRVVPRQV